MIFSCSDFIGGCEEFAGLHRRQALHSGRVSCGPARAEKAGLGDPGDSDGVGLVAAQHVEVRFVLTHRETDMTARPAFEDQYGPNDRLYCLPKQQPVARPVGICAQRAEKRFIGQGHADAGFHEIPAPRVLGRIAQGTAITFQPLHQPGSIAGLMAAEGRLRLSDPGQRPRRGDRSRAAVCSQQRFDRAGGAKAPVAVYGAGGMAEFVEPALDQADGFAGIIGHVEGPFARRRA